MRSAGDQMCMRTSGVRARGRSFGWNGCVAVRTAEGRLLVSIVSIAGGRWETRMSVRGIGGQCVADFGWGRRCVRVNPNKVSAVPCFGKSLTVWPR